METEKKTAAEQMTEGDLSEQIKAATKESHIRSESSEILMCFQRKEVTRTQYKLLLCSLYEIYKVLEEEMDRNCDHPTVAPIYFPAELARLESLENDLQFFYGDDWREKITVPAATKRYCHRLRQIGKDNPELLLPHAYTRYLGDLSGGQLLSRMAQKAMGLKKSEGLTFFTFSGVSSPNLFKQLYRSRMNSVELTKEQRKAVLEEAVMAFELNIQVLDDVQKMSVAEDKLQNCSAQSRPAILGTSTKTNPLLKMVLGLFVALATVSMGIYALI